MPSFSPPSGKNHIEAGPLLNLAPRITFIPKVAPRSLAEGKLIHSLHQKLSDLLPTLILIQDPMAFVNCSGPLSQIFYSPLNPDLEKRVVLSSRLVVSFQIRTLQLAYRAKIPCIFLASSRNNETAEMIKLGVPVIVANSGKAFFEEILRTLSNWPNWNQKNSKTPTSGAPRSKEMEPLAVCSISDINYLPHFLGLIENLREQTQGNVAFYLLALDEFVERAVNKHDPSLNIHIWKLGDLWKPTELQEINRRSLGFRAFSSKPKLLERTLSLVKRPVFHFDSDVYFYESPELLYTELNKSQALLFPHWNFQFPEARLDGLYNAGMIGVNSGAESFLNWWSDACLKDCSFNHGRGIVGDQGYLDVAPILFEGVKIYKGKDHNVARWNLKTLGVNWNSDKTRPHLANGTQIKSYHAAFEDDLHLFERKFAWDQFISFFSSGYEPNQSKALTHTVTRLLLRYWKRLQYVHKFKELFPNLPGLSFEVLLRGRISLAFDKICELKRLFSSRGIKLKSALTQHGT